MAEYQYLFRPLPVGHKVIKNRIIWGPHVTNHWPDHLPDARTTAYYAERAAGGVGMIIIGASPVDGRAEYSPFIQCALWDDACIPGLREIGEAVHRHDTVIVAQLVHPGVHQLPDHDPAHHHSVAPSQIPAPEEPFFIPRALEIEEIREIEDKFAAAAARAQAAGLDGIELHGAHGYLISAFLTPLKNKRDDAYGGSLENRTRFLREIIAKVRQRVGPDFIVGLRLSSSDMVEGGMEPEDVVEVVQMVEAAGGLDYLHCSLGLYRSIHYMIPSHYAGLEPGYQGELTAQIKAAARSLPVFVVGRINDPMLADKLIADGAADACVLIREIIAEPEFANKAQQNRIEEIRPCAYWNQSCVGHIFRGIRVECQMNAAAGRELEFGKTQLRPAAQPKNILVIGGGPAGLEFARIAASRGHRVVLHERGAELGGQVNQLARLPQRADVRNWVDWLVRQAQGSAAIDLRLNSEITQANVAGILGEHAVDEIVIASGARAAGDGRSSITTEPIPGHDRPHVMTYEALLQGQIPDIVSGRVLIIDELADRIAPGLAELLATREHEVEIVTRWPTVGHEFLMRVNELPTVFERLDQLGVVCTPNAWIKRIGEASVTAFNVYSGREWEIDVDTVVLVTMKYSNTDVIGLVKRHTSVPVHVIGDAVAPRQVADATLDATRLAHAL
ncbi:MAG TPA: FAD-dependent oxidoreductase [Gammaproteobacteria bacterium]|nr:FAD-dependent oxidoreductase [Gammaproteobacteria bacterium]